MPSATIAVRIEVQLDVGTDEAWTEILDVLGDWTATRGIHGGTPRDRVASTGTLVFDLNNGASNSAGLVGYYSLGHANKLAGWGLNVPVRIVAEYEELSTVIWQGVVDRITPEPGQYRGPRARVECVDWIDEAARAKPKGLSVATDVAAHQVFATLLATVGNQPESTYIGTGADIYPYALDNVQDESSNVLQLFQQLAQSEMGYIYMAAGGQLVFEGRRRRAGRTTARYDFDSDTSQLEVAGARDAVLNRMLVQLHPRRRDGAATTVLFSLPRAQQILQGTSLTFTAAYRDPSQTSQRVGGIDMVTPVSGTDYTFNSAQDGSGSSLLANLGVQVTFGGNSAEVTVTNSGPDGYLVTFQLRGRGLYDFEQLTLTADDAASIAALGENSQAIDMPFQSDPLVGDDVARFLVALHSAERTRALRLTYCANLSDALARQALEREISDRIGVAEAVTGIDADHFINGITYTYSSDGVLWLTYDLEIADASQYWQLEVVGRSELDETTLLGYGLFAAGWVLGESTLGTDTFVN